MAGGGRRPRSLSPRTRPPLDRPRAISRRSLSSGRSGLQIKTREGIEERTLMRLQYLDARKIGLRPHAKSTARALGLSLRQCQRIAAGESRVPGPVAKLLRLALQRHVKLSNACDRAHDTRRGRRVCLLPSTPDRGSRRSHDHHADERAASDGGPGAGPIVSPPRLHRPRRRGRRSWG
jgi:hypothetical protein